MKRQGTRGEGTFWSKVKLDFIGIYGVRWVKKGVLLGIIGYQRGNRVVVRLKR